MEKIVIDPTSIKDVRITANLENGIEFGVAVKFSNEMSNKERTELFNNLVKSAHDQLFSGQPANLIDE